VIGLEFVERVQTDHRVKSVGCVKIAGVLTKVVVHSTLSQLESGGGPEENGENCNMDGFHTPNEKEISHG
jgi:hypothetical protein